MRSKDENPSLLLPTERIHVLNEREINHNGDYVLYWMIANRRVHFNPSLERAIKLAEELGKPLLVFEAISTRHKFASDRIITFMVQGMLDNLEQFKAHKIRYIPWVSTPLQSGAGLLEKLAMRATIVITDSFPTYHPKHVVEQIKLRLEVRFEAVDGNGLLPMSVGNHAFSTAHAFRRHMHKNFVQYWNEICEEISIPKEHELWIPDDIFESILDSSGVELTPLEWLWRVSQCGKIGQTALVALDIDHEVTAVASYSGGHSNAIVKLNRFIDDGLDRYHTDRNDFVKPAVSGLSPWFHFGHLSTTEVVLRILQREKWNPSFIDQSRRGSRNGWWGLSEPIEAFLDQIITWRELGFNFAFHRDDHTSIESIPEWAKKSLQEHRNDLRKTYTFEQLEAAATDDELWNSAQRQLKGIGVIHNYLRMLWGKRILEWAPSPEIAADWMINLNDRWALDGRDPNSYTGIFWVLGRHDRAWGPERPVFGKVRYMSSANTARKLKVDTYLARWAKDAIQTNEFS
ncbi:MAG: deoxyribodipyrimidine photolyase [Candidatus Thermoplasmatota archaeon]|nr:deoxyribodipyrimidine photolyase [Candidatus Thermoplasmatota archaeon]